MASAQWRARPDYGDRVLIVLVFACVLLVAVLVSGFANRTILSTSVLFLVAGTVLGDGVLGAVPVTANDDLVSRLAELALFSVLFTDGMRVALDQLRCRIEATLPGGCCSPRWSRAPPATSFSWR